MTALPMTIDGAAVDGHATFIVRNPARGTSCGEAPDCSREQLDAAMESAARAQRSWRSDEAARRTALAAAAEVVLGAVEDVTRVLTAEQGKPLAEARLEVRSVAHWFRYFAALELPREVIQDDERARIEVFRRPLGVVAAITPWNFPLTLASWKLAPALLAGNTVVLKPSPYTPLSTLLLGQLLARVLPPGVLNVVAGGDHLGGWMTSHPVPRKLSFTGSLATGRLVAAAAVPDLKRITLELGGNDPAIVLDDVDPEQVASRLFWAAFRNNGQVCTAVKRVYVPERMYDDVVDALAAQARNAVVGDGMDEATQLGPVNNQAQLERVSGLVDQARAAGGRVVTGGRRPEGPGFFYEPTIVADVSDGVPLVDEEQFGPALPVIAYQDVDEAVARANGTRFGLSGSVWSADSERAAEVAARLECGTAWVNTHLVVRPDQPFGGAKWSGIGVENGRWGVDAFSEAQVLHLARG